MINIKCQKCNLIISIFSDIINNLKTKGVKKVMLELEENNRKLQDLKDRLLRIGDSL